LEIGITVSWRLLVVIEDGLVRRRQSNIATATAADAVYYCNTIQGRNTRLNKQGSKLTDNYIHKRVLIALTAVDQERNITTAQ
jgi:hypothetical protein